ncbi:MAG TPA: glycoside hydrolase family 3 N-terminal domain-containing protein, partial [Candidatus Limnocylindrales bacterium]
APAESSGPQPSGLAEPGLRTMIGQMLLVGFRGLTVSERSPIVRDIERNGLGGVILFDRDGPTDSAVRNIRSVSQLRGLVADLQAAARDAAATLPLIVAVDEEGGKVARLDPRHGFPATESAAALGRRGDAAYTERRGAEIGRTLGSVGINLDLAPVVDLDVNPANPIIGRLDRSFSADPDVVTEQALAVIRGQHRNGLRTTLKHFPGHGSSTADTHLGVVDVTDTWSERELEPFAAIIAAGEADAILTAHVFNAHLDRTYPATLSRATIGGLLRGDLGFGGVVVSDDLQMGAIRKAYGYPEAVALAIEAGVDVLIIANQQLFDDRAVARTIDIIEDHVATGRIERAMIEASWRRIKALKQTLLDGPTG